MASASDCVPCESSEGHPTSIVLHIWNYFYNSYNRDTSSEAYVRVSSFLHNLRENVLRH